MREVRFGDLPAFGTLRQDRTMVFGLCLGMAPHFLFESSSTVAIGTFLGCLFVLWVVRTVGLLLWLNRRRD